VVDAVVGHDDGAAPGDGPTHRVLGVGEAAVFYSLPDKISVLAAAKQSRGKLRTVVFAAPPIVPRQKVVDVERLVLDRI
jgi:hypothetical protein